MTATSKFVALILCIFLPTSRAEKNTELKENEVWVCSRWTWTSQDPYVKNATCITWTKKDCSDRLHAEICKTDNTNHKKIITRK